MEYLLVTEFYVVRTEVVRITKSFCDFENLTFVTV
jgi:hypothetical protein